MGKLRDRMPVVDAFIDELREALGREDIDRAIVDGLREGTFHAAENGHEIGVRIVDSPERTVRLDQMSPWNDVPRATRRKPQ
jgi:hypothetical protein